MIQRRRRFRRQSKELDISLTPLIDTALTLLVIFMITTPMIQNAILVKLPKGQSKEDDGVTQDLVVYVDKENHIFFNGTDMAPDNVVQELKQRVGDQKDKIVRVQADQEASYGRVIELVDHIKVVGGISHVVLAMQKYA